MKHLFITTILVCSALFSNAQDKQYKSVIVGFYNLENLFDTLDTEGVLDSENTPTGDRKWDTKKYNEKLGNLARVISEMGTTGSISNPDGPAILGVCEIENRSVLEDLAKQEAIKNRNYQVVHHDGPDHRGVDCALLYNPKYFTLISSKSIPLKIADDPDFKTRDQLLVKGVLDGDTTFFMVAHWPSRRGGEKRSMPKRIAAAELGKSVVDSIEKVHPGAKIVYMGDLNDDPNSPSVKKYMKAVSKPEQVAEGQMFGAMEKHFRQGIGTLGYRNNWNLFDQLILSKSLIPENGAYPSYKFFKSYVYNAPYLKNKEGSFVGYPYRTYVGNTYQGGYSDHFPVYMILLKEVK